MLRKKDHCLQLAVPDLCQLYVCCAYLHMFRCSSVHRACRVRVQPFQGVGDKKRSVSRAFQPFMSRRTQRWYTSCTRSCNGNVLKIHVAFVKWSVFGVMDGDGVLLGSIPGYFLRPFHIL